jgi:hypothetical protein
MSDEAAGHWFRRRLPSGWQYAAERDDDLFFEPSDTNTGKDDRWFVSSEDVRAFATTYCSVFVAVMLFFA